MLAAIIPYHKNELGLVSVLINLQAQARPHDLTTVIIVDTSENQKGKEIAQRYLSRSPINAYVVVKPLHIYQSWNEGIKLAENMDCLIINDDILMPNNFLQNLSRSRFLCPKSLCFVPRTPVMSYVGTYPPSCFSWQSVPVIYPSQLKPTGWMPGFVFYLTAECIKKVGLFDEKMLVWYGDNDYGRRIKQQGEITMLPDYVYHYGNQSYNYFDPVIKKQIYRDREYYLEKWKKI
ncbi:MAG: hypothetical protein WC389_19310 [Lutibacter sp.]|jgi:hypothetical protein